MTTSTPLQDRFLALIEWLKRFRYIKFGIVGASGTVVNMLVLFLGQEYLFGFIEDPRQRLYPALGLAIAVATLNNFTWNRLWTWADRIQAAKLHSAEKGLPYPRLQLWAKQLSQYALASWFGIALQYGLTLWLAHSLHYLVANVIAIVFASVSNFLANDYWTFRRRK
jgi:putative flippase GtrA